ncbi:pre-toxin TG domain-containing protein [Sutcliffiella cohnii]
MERDLANRSSRFHRLQSPNLMKRGNWWETYFSSDKRTRNRLINLLFPWLQLTFQRHFGLLYPIGLALSFNKWINPNSPREVGLSDIEKEKQAIVDYLKRVENGEVPSNMDQYAGMYNSYEGYIGENNIFGQPLGGNAPKNVETVAIILDFLPFIGNLKASSEAYLGYDPLTGRKLEDWERAVAAAAILGGGAARFGGKVVPKVVDKVGDLGKGIEKPLLPTEGKVGTFKELAKQGTAFDNITPHHMPSAAKMKQAGVKRNDGISMNMEQPHPGVGGRHRETYTYGLSGNKLEEYLSLSYRASLAHDILDVRRIYMKDGVYTPEIREGLLKSIRKNKELYPELFNK